MEQFTQFILNKTFSNFSKKFHVAADIKASAQNLFHSMPVTFYK